jgi:hypothetical protein
MPFNRVRMPAMGRLWVYGTMSHGIKTNAMAIPPNSTIVNFEPMPDGNNPMDC